MKTHQVAKAEAESGGVESPIGFPRSASLAALRAWYVGLNALAAVAHYLGHDNADGQSSRAMLSVIRKQLAGFARARHREDLASLLEHPAAERLRRARDVLQAIETVRLLPTPAPLVTDRVDQWLPPRAARALEAHGIKTLADLTVRVPRRRRWWAPVPGLGATSAKHIEAFFAEHAELTERARSLVPIAAQHDVVP
ncbi:Phage integrase protein [Xylophilus ampelinus]|nr:Phage integrase protein [Xylophilus ampelinus]